MKKMNKVITILAAALSFAVISCSGAANYESKNGSKKGTYLVATVENFENASARTILPEVTMESFDKFVITGTKEGDTVQLARFEESGNKTAYENMAGSSIPLSAGVWDLELTATTGNTKYSATVANKTIEAGRNDVSFSISMDSFGEYYSGTGGIYFRLYLPEDTDVVKAKVSLENYDQFNTTGSEFYDEIHDVIDSVLVYSSNSIVPGYYRLIVDLYADEDCSMYLNTYKEIVVVGSNLTSKADRTMSLTERLYTITYENIAEENVLSNYTLVETYSRYSTITLPDSSIMSKDGCTFAGWFTTSNFAPGSEITEIKNCTKDLTVYAKWERNYYTITYVDGGGTHSNPTQYQYGDSFTFEEPVVRGGDFIAWYTTDTYDFDTEIEGITDTTFGDITVYAKYDLLKFNIDYVAYADGVQIEVPASNNPTEYDCTQEITFELPAKEGYVLKGFYKTYSEGTFDDKIEGIEIGSINDITVYLNYISNNITSADLNAYLGALSTNRTYKIALTDDAPDFAVIAEALENHSDILVELDISAADAITEIPSNVFQGNENLVSIKLSDSITTISNFAFAGTKALKTVEFGSGITTIASRAFQNATGLRDMFIPDTVKTIGDYAFAGTKQLNIEITDSITSFGDYVFYASVEDVIKIPSCYVFEKAPTSSTERNNMLRLSNRNTIVFSDSGLINSIPDYAFAGATGIKVTIPESVYSVGEKIFNMISDAEIKASSGTIASVTDSTGCAMFKGLSSFTFEYTDYVSEIADYTFYNSKVQDFQIPETVTSIGDYAFAGINDLEITVPTTVNYVENTAFSGNNNLKLSVDAKIINDYASSNYANTLLNEIGTNLQVDLIESSTTSLDAYAFYKADNVSSVVISSSQLSSIKNYAFAYCSGLLELSIPNNVTSMGDYSLYYAGSNSHDTMIVTMPLKLLNNQAYGSSYPNKIFGSVYQNCYTYNFSLVLTNPEDETDTNYTDKVAAYALAQTKTLKSVTLPDNIETIGAYAFYYCNSLSEITIPESVTTINTYAFGSCSSINTINYETIGVLPTDNNVFNNCSSVEKVYIKDYETWMNWTKNERNCSPFYGSTEKNNTKLYIDNVLLESVSPYQDQEIVTGGNFYNIDSIKTVDLAGITTLNNYSFAYCDGITELTIPASITSMGDYVFSGDTSLSTVYFENEEKLYVSSSGFYECKAVEKVYVPNEAVWYNWNIDGYFGSPFYSSEQDTKLYIGNKLYTKAVVPAGKTHIESCWFYNVKSITSVKIPTSVEIIDNYAFRYCSNITELVIPESVTYIAQYAFADCTKLRKINIPSSVEAIIQYTFSNCPALQDVTLSNGLTRIDQNAFRNCSSLTEITIPETVETLGNSVFYGCNNLTQVNIPSLVTTIPSELFYGCSSLSQIDIPDNITSIGANVFYNCTNLTQVTIPNSVTSIGDAVFHYAGSDDNDTLVITMPLKLLNDKTYNSSSLYSNKLFGSTTSCYTKNFSLVLTNPEDVNDINYASGMNNYVLCRASNLKAVTIPENITSIGRYAFYECSSLQQIDIPATITKIQSYTFSYCSSLQQVIVPDSVTSIEQNAFERCSGLVELYIPNSVKEIGSSALSYVGSNNHDTLVITMPLKLLNSKVSSSTSYSNALFGGGYTTSYSENFSLILTNPDDTEDSNYTTEIVPYALNYEKGVKSVVLPENLTTIGNHAFRYAKNLREVNINNSVEEIGAYSFYECNSLTSVGELSSVRIINNYSFHDCYALESLGTLSSIEAIGDYAFYNCTSLNSLEGLSTLETIGEYAFYNCTALTGIGNLDSVTTVGKYAFQKCTSLQEFVITNTSSDIGIGENVFESCTALTNVVLPNNVRTLGRYAFMEAGSAEHDTLIITMPVKLLNDNIDTGNNNNYLFKSRGSSNYSTQNFKLVLTNPTDTADISYVTGIASYAMSNASQLKAVELPENITTIGNYAFRNCSSLESIGELSSVTSIGDYAFYSCTSLGPTVDLSSVTSIGSSAFYNCDSLESIGELSSITSIGSSAFHNCDGLQSVRVTNTSSPVSIESSAFVGCMGLVELYLSDTVNSIGNNALANIGANSHETLVITMPIALLNARANSNSSTYVNYIFGGSSSDIAPVNFRLVLTNPTGETGLAAYALCNLKNLKAIELPEEITTIGNYAFNNCISLGPTVDLSSATIIGNYAFYNCNFLESVGDLSTVITIGDYAFYNCGSLESIGELSSVSTIGKYAFYNCIKLQSIRVTNTSSPVSIGESAFHGCVELVEMYLSDKVISIGYSALAKIGSNDHETLVITMPIKPLNAAYYTGGSNYANTIFGGSNGSSYYPKNFRMILTNASGESGLGQYALCNLQDLKAVELPDNITSIGIYAFYNCTGLTELTIPDSVTTIGEKALSKLGSDSHETLVITMPIAPLNAKSYSSTSYVNYIFGGSTTSYAPNNFRLVLTNPTSETGLAAYALCNLTNLKAVELPEDITSIGNYAFYYCSGLTVLELGTNILTVGTDACYQVPYVHNHSAATGAPWGALAISDSSVTEVIASTCSEPGIADVICDYEGCEAAGGTMLLPLLPHTETHSTYLAPTCKENGIERYECSVCGSFIRDEVIPASDLYHNVVDGVCTICGSTIVTWTNDSNGEYCFVQKSGEDLWVSNNKGVHSSSATSTWTITVPQEVTYILEYRVSSESSCDKLTIKFDETIIADAISGTSSKNTEITLTAGTHTISATYKKDSSVNSNDDLGELKLSRIVIPATE